MINEAQRIEEQLKHAHEGGAWHGPSVSELLSDVAAEQAAARPIEGAHSIWELTLHIAAWEEAVRRRLINERAEVTDEENFPPVTDTSEEAWQRAIEHLSDINKRLRETVSEIQDSRLEEPIMQGDGMSSTYVTLHGAVQHTLYHAGQIAMLKKALKMTSDKCRVIRKSLFSKI
jgi:uncharacterized damage-inducible protein DinB